MINMLFDVCKPQICGCACLYARVSLRICMRARACVRGGYVSEHGTLSRTALESKLMRLADGTRSTHLCIDMCLDMRVDMLAGGCSATHLAVAFEALAPF